MVEKVANRDRLPVLGKVGKKISEPVFIMQFAIMHQQHYRRRGELFRARGETEIAVRVDFPQCTQVGYAVSLVEKNASVIEN